MAEGTHRTVVDTASGKVRGAAARGAIRFKGIPYAAPPVGPRRFAPPVPAEPWTGVLDGTRRPPIAPQPLGAMESMAGAAGAGVQSEEACLTLNIWTESVAGPPRPVMVWIHGGAFVTGTGSTPWYDGANLATRGVVVVTANYRLGALGFCHLAGIGGDSFTGAANAGLLDQALALRWVRENIAAFGGDPDRVTIFGESAGGMSVSCQLALPAATGLFRTAIPQSGAASNVHDAESGERVARSLLAALGIEPGEAAALRDVPVEALLQAQVKVGGDFGVDAGLPFRPTVDGDTLPEHPLRAVAAGSAAGVALVTGWNRDEMKLFTAIDPALASVDEARLSRIAGRIAGDRAADLLAAYRAELDGASTREVAEALLTDWTFRVPATRLLDAHAAHAPATHGYEFRFESRAFGGRLGAAHAVEIPFVFDNLDAPGAAFFTGEPDDAMRGLAADMADAWVQVATTGSPNPSALPDWPGYDPERHTMVLDLAPSVEADPAAATRRVWDELGL